MSAKIETVSIAAEIVEESDALRQNLAMLIRSRAGLTTEERSQFEQHGLKFDSDSGEVIWSPPPGEESDRAAERRHLLCAIDLLVGPIEPITAEELAEALARGQTFGEMLAELGVFDPNGGKEHEQ